MPLRTPDQPKILVEKLDFFYGANQALKGNTLTLADRKITALIGPSGCGKSTHIRCYNRMFELYPGHRATGRIMMDGQNLLDPNAVDGIRLRSKVGMVFQKPTPFPMSIWDNVAFGLRLRGLSAADLALRVERALADAALWDEVKDRLSASGQSLSGGQQQRLCVARALAVEPEVLLLDEPASALDPIATARIEELIRAMRGRITVVLVTHNMQQAARVSDYTAFFYLGEIVEHAPTDLLFTRPRERKTEEYITGKFG
jgi:phosphate transport system ATP-binding protein